MEIVFYVDGRQSIVKVDPETILKEAAQKAMDQKKINTPLDEFKCVSHGYYNRKTFDLNLKIFELVALGSYDCYEKTQSIALFLIHNSKPLLEPINPYRGRFFPY